MTMILEMNPGPWLTVNDGVMGGISSSRLVEADGVLTFAGELSLENNGGFASVRRMVENDLSQITGVRLEVRGDQRTYQFRLRQNDRFDGVAWRAEFNTTEEWQTLELPFNQFVPVFRGRRVPEAGPVVPSSIKQVGFLLADETPGPFRLQIRKIEFTSH